MIVTSVLHSCKNVSKLKKSIKTMKIVYVVYNDNMSELAD